MKRYHFTIIIFLLILGQSGFSQPTTVEHILLEDGLPSDIVKALVIDSTGFIWVATDGGLAKIEGRNIIKVTDSKMSTGKYKDILSSKKYGLVAACDGELLKIKQDYKGIYSHKFIDGLNISDYIEFQYPKNMFESQDSSLWIADITNVVHIKESKATTFYFPEKNYTKNFFRNYQFMELDEHQLFILSQKGYMYSYNNAKDTMVEIPWKYAGTEIFAIHKLNTHQFLIGCGKGLLKITFNNGWIDDVTDLQFEYGAYVIEPLKENRFLVGTLGNGAYNLILNDKTITYNILSGSEGQAVLDIILDNQQQVWLGTGYGLYVFRHIAFENLFKEVSISEIIELKSNQNNHFFLTDKKSVYQSNKDKVLSKSYTLKQGIITSICPVNNSLWIGTNKGQLIEKQNNGNVATYDFSNEGNEIQSLAIDKSLAVWFIQKRKGKSALLRMDPTGKIKDFTPNTKEKINLRFLKLSPNGEVYVGAMGLKNYLFKYNCKENTIDNLSLPIDSLKVPLLIHDIAFAPDRTCLLATQTGIFKYDGTSIKRLDLGEISNEMVTGIAIDSIGRIWFGHSTGIICYNGGELLVYDNSDGLSTKTTSYRCLQFDSDNGFWIGSTSGMLYGKMPSVFKASLAPILDRIENLGSPIDLNGKNKFLQNSLLKVGFTSPNYPAQYVKYQYSLSRKNVIENWKDIEFKQDYLTFDYLVEGSYTLKIRAKSKGHYSWSKPVVFQFRIYKIWYTRAEYIIGINLFVLLLGYLYLRYRQEKSTKEKTKLESIIADRTKDLQVQNEKLIIAKKKTEEAIKTKDLFFSILGHDLSSPFSTLIGFSKMLVENPKKFTEEKKSIIFTEMLKTSENTYKLLQNLLEWSMSQTGKLNIIKEQIDYKNLITEVLTTLKTTAKQKGISIRIEIEEDIRIFADKAMISTVLRNLISNAIKFSNANSEILISARMNNSYCYISVTDTGVSIPEDIINKLFAIDKSISTMGTNKEKGTGLGLVLCKEFVMLNQGDIRVKSSQNKGSTFTVKLPSKQM